MAAERPDRTLKRMRRPDVPEALAGVASTAALAMLAWIVVTELNPPMEDCTRTVEAWRSHQNHVALVGVGVCWAAAALSLYSAGALTGGTKRAVLVAAFIFLFLGGLCLTDAAWLSTPPTCAT